MVPRLRCLSRLTGHQTIEGIKQPNPNWMLVKVIKTDRADGTYSASLN